MAVRLLVSWALRTPVGSAHPAGVFCVTAMPFRIVREFEPDQQAVQRALRILLESPIRPNTADAGNEPETGGRTAHLTEPTCHSTSDAVGAANDGARPAHPLSSGSSSPETI